MDFTREPIIETVITPKEGCTLVVRSSKSSGQDEHFVDAVEVVAFGNSIFFRSRERPKAFLVPVSDYEILEVRETRLLLKNVSVDRAIKIAGGREAPLHPGREVSISKGEQPVATSSEKNGTQQGVQPKPQELPLPEDSATSDAKLDIRGDKKRDRRRNHRRRRGKEDGKGIEDAESGEAFPSGADNVELPAPHLTKEEITATSSTAPVAALLSSLLSPPPNLISETIARYKDNVLFKGAFFSKEVETDDLDEDQDEGEETENSGNEEDEVNEGVEKEENSNVDRPHGHLLHEGLSEQHEEIEVPQMSLDYPVYGFLEKDADSDDISEGACEVAHEVECGVHEEPVSSKEEIVPSDTVSHAAEVIADEHLSSDEVSVESKHEEEDAKPFESKDN